MFNVLSATMMTATRSQNHDADTCQRPVDPALKSDMPRLQVPSAKSGDAAR